MRGINRWFILALTPWLGSLGNLGRADTVILQNGDRITGTITRITPTNVQVDTAALGALTIQRSGIKTLESIRKIAITDSFGDTHQAYLAPAPDGLSYMEVPLPSTAAPTAVTTTAPATNPHDLDPYHLPVGPHWKNQLALGILDTTGNTESSDFSGQLDFNYLNQPHELTLSMRGDYAVNQGTQTTGLALGDALYRRSLPEFHSDRLFLFVETHELYDGIKGISFRSNSSMGPGYYLWKDEKLHVDVRSGPGFTYLRLFDGTTHTDPTGIFGLRAVYHFNTRVSLEEEALYTNSLADTTRWQFTSDAAVKIKLPELARGIGLKFGFRDDYDNSATTPHKKNDSRLALALTLDF